MRRLICIIFMIASSYLWALDCPNSITEKNAIHILVNNA